MNLCTLLLYCNILNVYNSAPHHSCKYAAELQRRLTNGGATGGPCLLKVIKDAGHGSSDSAVKSKVYYERLLLFSTTSQRLTAVSTTEAETAAAILAFVALSLNRTTQSNEPANNGIKRRKLSEH